MRGDRVTKIPQASLIGTFGVTTVTDGSIEFAGLPQTCTNNFGSGNIILSLKFAESINFPARLMYL